MGRTGAQLWAIVRENLREGLWSKRSAWGKVTAKSQLFKLAQQKYLEEVDSFFRCAAQRSRAGASAAPAGLVRRYCMLRESSHIIRTADNHTQWSLNKEYQSTTHTLSATPRERGVRATATTAMTLRTARGAGAPTSLTRRPTTMSSATFCQEMCSTPTSRPEPRLWRRKWRLRGRQLLPRRRSSGQSTKPTSRRQAYTLKKCIP